MRRAPLAVIALLLVCAGCDRRPRLFVVGDSTAASYDASVYPLFGWGMALRCAVEPETKLVNVAVSGASSQSYLQQRWWRTRPFLHQGDTVLIGFGRNDAVQHTPIPLFEENLRAMIRGAKAARARAILYTPTARLEYDAGRVVDTMPDYSAAARKVAAAEQVPLFDLTARQMALQDQLGASGAAGMFMLRPGKDGRPDHTHLTEYGARQVARLWAADFGRLGVRGQMPATRVRGANTCS